NLRSKWNCLLPGYWPQTSGNWHSVDTLLRIWPAVNSIQELSLMTRRFSDMSERFLQALDSGKVLLMDGAMGTELQRAGIGEGECYELWNLTHPEKVRAIHQAYVDAGADVLLTHTFQASPDNLAKFGLGDRLEMIWESALENCRSIAGTNRFV